MLRHLSTHVREPLNQKGPDNAGVVEVHRRAPMADDGGLEDWQMQTVGAGPARQTQVGEHPLREARVPRGGNGEIRGVTLAGSLDRGEVEVLLQQCGKAAPHRGMPGPPGAEVGAESACAQTALRLADIDWPPRGMLVETEIGQPLCRGVQRLQTGGWGNSRAVARNDWPGAAECRESIIERRVEWSTSRHLRAAHGCEN